MNHPAHMNRPIPGGQAASGLRTRLLAYTALSAAMITLMTAYICHIPLGFNGGYIHLGDSLIYLTAALLPTPCAVAAAAVGGGIADLLTAPMWTPVTLVVKALIALPFTSRHGKILCARNIAAPFIALAVSGCGYYLANAFLMGGFKGGLIAYLLSGSLFQSAGSAVIFFAAGACLDRTGFKKRFLSNF